MLDSLAALPHRAVKQIEELALPLSEPRELVQLFEPRLEQLALDERL